jgi:hypothetical protein
MVFGMITNERMSPLHQAYKRNSSEAHRGAVATELQAVLDGRKRFEITVSCHVVRNPWRPIILHWHILLVEACVISVTVTI